MTYEERSAIKVIVSSAWFTQETFQLNCDADEVSKLRDSQLLEKSFCGSVYKQQCAVASLTNNRSSTQGYFQIAHSWVADLEHIQSRDSQELQSKARRVPRDRKNAGRCGRSSGFVFVVSHHLKSDDMSVFRNGFFDPISWILAFMCVHFS